jgi:transcriptional repressor NrdR
MSCGHRFTTYERIEEVPLMVVKKEGHREQFERGKVLRGLLRACEKRPVSPQQLESLVDSVEKLVSSSGDREVTSREIGEILMNQLKLIDKVAYVRFASVYLDFKNVHEFLDEIRDLVKVT